MMESVGNMLTVTSVMACVVFGIFAWEYKKSKMGVFDKRFWVMSIIGLFLVGFGMWVGDMVYDVMWYWVWINLVCFGGIITIMAFTITGDNS